MKRVSYLLLVLFVATAFAVSGAFAQTPAPDAKAAWTVLFYMDSDNNLEAPQMQDLDEMMTAGSSADVNLIVLCDRSSKGESSEDRGYTSRDVGGIKNWTTAKMFRVEKGRLVEIADFGEADMGDPATLARFIDAALTRFPAERYGLVFGDHGAGWVGIGSDESANSDSLTAAELPTGLKGVAKFTPRLDLIGFDACLMANLEAAKAVAPFARTMVASEEIEPGEGWDYVGLFKSRAALPSMDGPAFGRRIAETFRDFYLGGAEKEQSVTLSVIDLDKVAAMETAVNGLAARGRALLAGGATGFQKTARARSKADEFGKASQPEEAFFFYDIADFASHLKLQSPDAETAKAADAAVAAVKGAVLFKVAGAEHARSAGISIYLPPRREFANQDYLTTQFAKTAAWTPFIDQFMAVGSGDTKPPEVAPVTVSDADVAASDVISVSSSVRGDDIDDATFVLAQMIDDRAVIVGAVPSAPDEKGVLHEDWDGTWFTITDGDSQLLCPISDAEPDEDSEDAFYIEVPVQVRYEGSKRWRDVNMYFYVSFAGDKVTGEFVDAYIFEGRRAREFEFAAGDSIRPVYLSVDADGREEQVAATDGSDILKVTSENDISVGREDVEPGHYLIGFAVTDLAGNANDEFTEVVVE